MIPDPLVAKLLANAALPDTDHDPVVKLFHPLSAATWLLTELNPNDMDTAFGLCDLGLGFPELGFVSLAEIDSLKESYGVAVQYDPAFTAQYPLSVYAEAARHRRSITNIPSLLDAAAARLAAQRGRNSDPQ